MPSLPNLDRKENQEFVDENCELLQCRIRPHCIEIGRTCAAISRLHQVNKGER